LDLWYNYAKAPTSTYFHNEFSIVVWFNRNNKYNDIYFNDNVALFDFSFDNSRNIALAILDKNANKNFQIIFWAKKENGSTIDLTAKYQINDNEWYHIAITYSSNSKSIYLYVNGIFVSSRYVDLILLGETNLNYIGRSDAIKQWESRVQIDEIKIYNRALNSSEITTDSNDRPIATTPSGTTTRDTTLINKCKYYFCYNGGTCYTDYYNGDPYCVCKSNYYGTYCEKSKFF
jgi:hypothetical protein